MSPETTPSTKRLPKTSPTAIEADWRCPRERFYMHEWGGVGLRPHTEAVELHIGRVVAEGLRAYFLSLQAEGNFDKATDVMLEVVRAMPLLNEPWQTWIEASLRAWGTRVWPGMSKHYRILHVEQMFEFTHAGVRFKVKPDLVIKDLRDGSIWYVEFKTFSQWDQRKWAKAVQLQVGAECLERTLGGGCAGVLIVGLWKGTVRDDKLYHPLVAGYRRLGEPGIVADAYSYGYKRGFERFDAHLYKGGIPRWVADAPDSVISETVVLSGPIFRNPRLINKLLQQRSAREKDIASSDNYLNEERTWLSPVGEEVFEQRFAQCESKYRTCPAIEICWHEAVERDPLGSGLYELRYIKGSRPDGYSGDSKDVGGKEPETVGA